MLEPALAILISCLSRKFAKLENTNIIRFFVAYSEYASLLIVHMVDMIMQDTNSLPEH